MRRLIPFLLRSKRRLRRVPTPPPPAPASASSEGSPFPTRKDRDKTPGLRLLKPDKT